MSSIDHCRPMREPKIKCGVVVHNAWLFLLRLPFFPLLHCTRASSEHEKPEKNLGNRIFFFSDGAFRRAILTALSWFNFFVQGSLDECDSNCGIVLYFLSTFA